MCPPRFRREGRYGEGIYLAASTGQAVALCKAPLSGVGGCRHGRAGGEHPCPRHSIALVGPAKRGGLRVGQRASAALGGAEIGPAHRAGAGAGDERRRSGDPDGGQQPSAGKPAAQRKGICLQDEVGGHEAAGGKTFKKFAATCGEFEDR